MDDYYMDEAMPSEYLITDIMQTEPSDPLDLLIARTDFQTPMSNVLSASSSNIHLSAKEQSDMMQSIQDIFQLEEEQVDEDEEMNGEDGEPEIDLEDQQRRVEKLKGVLTTLAQLWWSDSQHMDVAAEKLADGSRDPKWRIPLGDSGVLNFFLEILKAHSLRHTLKIHILRLIGNSCADTDENRERVVASNYLPSIIIQLRETSLLPFVIPVLYNICIDYEPAQAQASTSFLGKELVDLISSPRFEDNRPFLGYISKLFSLLALQPSELELAPENTAVVLLKIVVNRESPIDMEDYISLINAAIAYLQHVKFQQAIISHGALRVILGTLLHSYTRFDAQPSIGETSPDEEDAKALQQMRSSLNQVLSDVSALPEFQVAIPVTSAISATIRRWLSSPQLQLQVCACIMLGNLARSDAACEEFVHISKIHIPLIAILKDTNDSQLLHAALGFLKNLALPIKNKEPLGDAGIFDVLPRLWLLDTLQQIQFSSISLTRQLINNTYENVRKVCHRLSEDKDSPANMRSKLSLLIALFERTDVEPIKMEIARLITAVCRVYNSLHSKSLEDMERIRKKFFTMHPDVGRPLSFMVSQTKWPVVRSEGWFVFALMARYPDGAQCISDMMQDVTVFQPLVELLTGKTLVEYGISSPGSSPSGGSLLTSSPSGISNISSPSDSQTPESVKPHAQADEMARIDRENALVLISELLKNRGSEMAVMRRTLFEDLLKGGGNLVLSYREGKTAPKNLSHVKTGLTVQESVQQAGFEFS